MIKSDPFQSVPAHAHRHGEFIEDYPPILRQREFKIGVQFDVLEERIMCVFGREFSVQIEHSVSMFKGEH